jgi:hypothetical protein
MYLTVFLLASIVCWAFIHCVLLPQCDGAFAAAEAIDRPLAARRIGLAGTRMLLCFLQQTAFIATLTSLFVIFMLYLMSRTGHSTIPLLTLEINDLHERRAQLRQLSFWWGEFNVLFLLLALALYLRAEGRRQMKRTIADAKGEAAVRRAECEQALRDGGNWDDPAAQPVLLLIQSRISRVRTSWQRSSGVELPSDDGALERMYERVERSLRATAHASIASDWQEIKTARPSTRLMLQIRNWVTPINVALLLASPVINLLFFLAYIVFGILNNLHIETTRIEDEMNKFMKAHLWVVLPCFLMYAVCGTILSCILLIYTIGMLFGIPFAVATIQFLAIPANILIAWQIGRAKSKSVVIAIIAAILIYSFAVFRFTVNRLDLFLLFDFLWPMVYLAVMFEKHVHQLRHRTNEERMQRWLERWLKPRGATRAKQIEAQAQAEAGPDKKQILQRAAWLLEYKGLREEYIKLAADEAAARYLVDPHRAALPEPQTRGERIQRWLLSRGVIYGTSGISRGLTVITQLLLIPSMLALQLSPVSEQLRRREVRLSDLRVALSEEQWQRQHRQQINSAYVLPPDAETVIHEIAAAYERANRGAIPVADKEKPPYYPIRAAATRSDILTHFVEARRQNGTTSAEYSSTVYERPISAVPASQGQRGAVETTYLRNGEQAVAELAGEERRSPVSAATAETVHLNTRFGQQMAAKLHVLLRYRPDALASWRKSLESFRTTASYYDITYQLQNSAMSELLDDAQSDFASYLRGVTRRTTPQEETLSFLRWQEQRRQIVFLDTLEATGDVQQARRAAEQLPERSVVVVPIELQYIARLNRVVSRALPMEQIDRVASLRPAHLAEGDIFPTKAGAKATDRQTADSAADTERKLAEQGAYEHTDPAWRDADSSRLPPPVTLPGTPQTISEPAGLTLSPSTGFVEGLDLEARFKGFWNKTTAAWKQSNTEWQARSAVDPDPESRSHDDEEPIREIEIPHPFEAPIRNTVLFGGTDGAPTTDTADITEVRWAAASNGAVRVTLISSDGTRIVSQPFRSSILYQALTFAADGRDTAVTMIPMPPLREVRIVLHPSLVDSPLGSGIIELDRFVDRFAPPDSELRKDIESDVDFQRNLYLYADLRRACLLAPTARSAEAKAVRTVTDTTSKILHIWLSSHDVRFRQKILAAADPSKSILIACKSALDAELVDQITSALHTRDPMSDLDRQLKQRIAAVEVETITAQQDALWKRIRERSGLKRGQGNRQRLYLWSLRPASAPERSQTSDHPGTESPADTLARWRRPAPRFIVRTAVIANPAPVDLKALLTGSTPEGQSLRFVLRVFVEGDATPWVIPSALNKMQVPIQRALDGDLRSREIYRDAAEAACLVRFFRLAFDGRLGKRFPIEKLAALARAVQPDARAGIGATHTLRWHDPTTPPYFPANAKPQAGDRQMVARLRQSFGIEAELKREALARKLNQTPEIQPSSRGASSSYRLSESR